MYSGQLIIKPICAKLTYDTETFGSMDCYAKITVGGSTYKTDKAHDQGTNPNWEATFTFRVNGDQLAYVQIYDQDDGSADDFVGECQVELQQVYATRNVNKWFPLTRKGRSSGQIMMNLEFYPDGGQQMGGQMGGQMGMGGGYGGQMGGYGGQMGGYGGQMGGYGGQMGGNGGQMGGYGGQMGGGMPGMGGMGGGFGGQMGGYGNPGMGGNPGMHPGMGGPGMGGPGMGGPGMGGPGMGGPGMGGPGMGGPGMGGGFGGY